MPEKATAAPGHGAAVVAIVIEQNGNAASVMRRKLRERRVPLFVISRSAASTCRRRSARSRVHACRGHCGWSAWCS
ncbi:MAG: hypothetical protein DI523_33355 [Paraburkholderia fungorum]|nr:MAG: hypothetical protein DI523_33355 [Paraburkholderia fungorum]